MSNLENVSYCGIYCAKCYLLKDNPAALAQSLLIKFKAMKFEKWGPALAKYNAELKAFEHVEQCYQLLKAWEQMICPTICRNGGGSMNCTIRECCVSHKLEGCWQCLDVAACDKLASLNIINGNMIRSNIKMIREKGLDTFCKELDNHPGCLFYKEL
ncbi:MAG: DUF3795 domain-containing protein [Deltaproteobacteria bacterium]|nr:DUF3795 domain-containing protein [Deltaproteobacteria bacterium]